jgi:hypothetical protein
MLAKRALCVALVGLGALDAVSGTRNDANPNRTLVEGESAVFRAAMGLSLPGGKCQQCGLVAWQDFDNYVGPYLSRGQMIIVDTGVDFDAPLFSTYPRQWVIPSDQDFQGLAENFSGQFQWLLLTPSAKTTSQTPEMYQALASSDGGHWKPARYFGSAIGQLYRWVPSRAFREGSA